MALHELLHGIENQFIHICDGLWLMLIPGKKEDIVGKISSVDWIKKVTVTVVAMLLVSFFGAAFNTYLSNRDQDREIALITSNLSKHEAESDRKFEEVHAELREARNTTNVKLDLIIKKIDK